MSGNPFRRSQAVRPADAPPLAENQTPPNNAHSTKKKVKILSPPDSPESPPRRQSSGRISPPPPPKSPDNDGGSDTTASADSDLERASLNTRRNSGSLPPPAVGDVGISKAPYNPFARTLATSEAAYGLTQTPETQKDASIEDTESQQRLNASKPAMNVDQFKNILMTGNAVPSAAPTIPAQRLHDNSSSTDTSSVSRQSLFDPMLETHPESPRTSFDQLDTLESPSEDEYDDGSTLMTSKARLDDMAPPAPPKPTAAKTVVQRGPQTVSFADFDQSIPSSSGKVIDTPTPLITNNLSSTKKPSPIPKSPSDLNKPLPAPPPKSPSLPNDEHFASLPISKSTEDPAQQKKIPPPPPPASRRTGHGRDRSGSNPAREITPEDEPLSHPNKTMEIPLKSSAPPPPPPSRRAKPTVQTPVQMTQPAVEAPSPISADSKAAMPIPPPPRRNHSKQGSVAINTPSQQPQQQSTNLTTTQSNPAPPAPPPRRISARPSLDGRPASLKDERRRSSAPSVDTERSSSLHSVAEDDTGRSETVQSAGSMVEHRDILADMSAFQAEIDALRARAEEGKG